MKLRSLFWLFCLCFTMCLMTGCGPTLKEYVAKSNNYVSQLSTVSSPNVTIGDKKSGSDSGGVWGAIVSTVNTATSVAGYAVAREQEARLRNIVNPSSIADIMACGFNDNFIDKTHLVYVNADARPDLRVFLSVEDFGLYAESMLSAMNFYLYADIKIVYTPELETIYHRKLVVEREASSVVSEMMNLSNDALQRLAADHAFMLHIIGFREKMRLVGDVVSIAAGIASMQAFFDMTDEDVAVIFEYMAYDAGQTTSMRLVDDIYR